MQIRKLIFLIVAIVSSIATPSTAIAQNQNNNGSGSNTSTTILIFRPQSHRPKLPGQLTITVTYADAMMNFELPAGASYMEVSICKEPGEEILSGTVTSDASALPTTLNVGEYIITCTTNTNQIFTGSICI